MKKKKKNMLKHIPWMELLKTLFLHLFFFHRSSSFGHSFLSFLLLSTEYITLSAMRWQKISNFDLLRIYSSYGYPLNVRKVLDIATIESRFFWKVVHIFQAKFHALLSKELDSFSYSWICATQWMEKCKRKIFQIERRK